MQISINTKNRLSRFLRLDDSETVAGEAGVAHATKLLRDEMHADMGLLGINHLSELNPGFLYR